MFRLIRTLCKALLSQQISNRHLFNTSITSCFVFIQNDTRRRTTKLEINSLPYVNLPEGTYSRYILSFGSPHVELRFYCQIHTGDTRLTLPTRRLEGNLVKGICTQETEFTVAKIASSTLRPQYTAKLGLG